MGFLVSHSNILIGSSLLNLAFYSFLKTFLRTISLKTEFGKRAIFVLVSSYAPLHSFNAVMTEERLFIEVHFEFSPRLLECFFIVLVYNISIHCGSNSIYLSVTSFLHEFPVAVCVFYGYSIAHTERH